MLLDDLSIFLGKLKEKYKNLDIILFGSFVWGKPRNDSDIDIAIRTDSMVDYFDVMEEIEECNSIYNFDILNFNTLKNDSLKERILKYGKQI